jgi:hypothetical protein
MSEVGGYRAGRTDVRRQMSGVAFVVWAGLLIFLFSMVLEVVQFYLPYRTFNVYDVVANGIGVLLFVVLMLFISHPDEIGKKKAFHRAGRPTQTDTDICPADPPALPERERWRAGFAGQK